jgi:cysteinyl-tRNA synthetase
MASAVHGPSMDVHSGGVDLAFPHHDNEIAQSEVRPILLFPLAATDDEPQAHHGCRQWVNYFLHTGHLHIEGLKMSKSLKNFITIEDALTRHTARQLRFSFLSTTWHAKLDFKESSMQDVASSEAILNVSSLHQSLAGLALIRCRAELLRQHERARVRAGGEPRSV